MRRLLPVLLLVAACAGGGDTAAPASEVAEGPVLSDEAYRFCHREGADYEQAREFCALLDEIPEGRCPGLRATCDEGAQETVLDPGGCNGGGGTPGSSPAPPPQRPEEPFSWELEPMDCSLPDSAGGWAVALLKWGAAMAVALLVLVVIRLVVGVLGWGRSEEPEPVVEEQPARVEVPEGDEVPEVPSADLLAAAREALAEGRWGDAVVLSRGAVLRRLGDTGRVRLHPARTDREYLRSVRRDDEVHGPLREVLRAVERHRWGGVEVGRDLASRVVATAERLVGVVAVVLLAVLLTGSSADRYRYSPQGDAALYEVFARHGFDVSWRLRGLASLGDEADVLVMDLTGMAPGDEAWQAVRDWVSEGRLLVVAGSAEEGLPDLGVPTDLPLDSQPRLVPGIDGWLPPPAWPDGPVWGWQDPRGTVPWVQVGGRTPDEANTHAVGGEVAEALPEQPVHVIQVLYLGDGAVLAISDARLLWNGSLVAPANEEFLGRMLGVGHTRGYWELPEPTRVQLATLAAAGSESPMGALANARLLPLVIQLLILAALVALWKGWPFGPLRDPPEEGRHRFEDHVRALGARYARLGSSRHALAAYAGLWLGRLGAHGLREAAVQAGRDPAEADQLIQELQAVVEEPDGPDRASDVERMEALWSITKRR